MPVLVYVHDAHKDFSRSDTEWELECAGDLNKGAETNVEGVYVEDEVSRNMKRFENMRG